MAQLQLKSLLGKANAIIEKGSNFFGKVLVDKEEMLNLIEEIVACIPADIKEAEMIIANKDKTIQDAQNRAERIIQEGIHEQSRLVSDNEIMSRVKDAVAQQKQQVDEYCESIQAAAAKNAEDIKISAIREAAQIKDSADVYVEQVFQEAANSMSQLLNKIVVCQNVLAQRRANNNPNVPGIQPQLEAQQYQEYTQNNQGEQQEYEEQ
ncbi:MAG: hypothetical protein ACI4B8_02700 [Candidatus Gastranaerophilaceae bacterium]